MSSKPGGPQGIPYERDALAFPLAVTDWNDHPAHPQKGMTLRDYFAGQVLESVLTLQYGQLPAALADNAYKIADAMMQRRRRLDR